MPAAHTHATLLRDRRFSPADAYRRLRHTYGYGVHSPFAYMFVTEILRTSCEYYAEADIRDSFRHADTAQMLDALLLHRMAARLRFRKAYIDPRAGKPVAEAVRAADSRIHIEHRPRHAQGCDLMYVTHPAPAADIPLPCEGGALLLRGASHDTMRRLCAMMTRGLALYSPAALLLIDRPGMTFTSYTVML